MSIETILLIVFAVVTALSVLTSIITQVIKELPKVSEIPTSLVCYVVSMVICIISGCVGYEFLTFHISLPLVILLSIVCSFPVSLISMSGWEKVKQIVEHIVGKDVIEEIDKKVKL